MLDAIKSIVWKAFLSMTALVVCHIPVGLIISFKYLLSPEGFWQKAFAYGVGIYLLGGIQIALWVLLVGALVIIWEE